MEIFIVATPIGNINDITIRAKDVLNDCDVVFAEDTRVSKILLNKLGILDKKIISCHNYNEEKIAENLLNFKGQKIVLITDAGTPAISDPGSVVVNKAYELGFKVIAIPGASALICAISVSGFLTSDFSFLGFLPREKNKQTEVFNNLKNYKTRVFAFYESPLRIIETLNNLKIVPIENICVFNDLTKLYEKTYRGSLEDVITQLTNNKNFDKGEYVVVFKLGEKQEESENILSLEGKIVDEVIKNNCTLKEAVANLNKLGDRKNALYKAMLNIKEITKQ